jgi:hypothetical protein
VKVAEVALAATLTEAGMVKRVGALLASVTTVLTVAAFDSVTVHVVLALEARLAAPHCRVERVTEATNDRVTVLDEPFSVAVIVAA